MDFYWHGKGLLEELNNIKEVTRIKVASAYFSSYGLHILSKWIYENKLEIKDVELYLSPYFSYDHPGSLLEQAKEICKVYIVEKVPFHAKVYWFEEKKGTPKLIFGSSNFTEGGIKRNIEFDLTKSLDNREENDKISYFFDFCKNNAILVTESIIDRYKSNERKLIELREAEKQIKQSLFHTIHPDDSFNKDTYDLSKHYFKFEDYEIFFPRNIQRKDQQMMIDREALKERIMDVHKRIYTKSFRKKYNLNCHGYKPSICSLTNPCKYNRDKVVWLGVRYGKSPVEVDILNKGASKYDRYAFQKHACIQFSITKAGFEINLFHAVSNGALDRYYVHEQIEKNIQFEENLTNEIRKLQGGGFVWNIFNYEESPTLIFDLDKEEPESFIDFYREYDQEGRESFLSCVYEPDDPRIQTLDDIEMQIIYQVEKLIPLYGLLAQRLDVSVIK